MISGITRRHPVAVLAWGSGAAFLSVVLLLTVGTHRDWLCATDPDPEVKKGRKHGGPSKKPQTRIFPNHFRHLRILLDPRADATASPDERRWPTNGYSDQPLVTSGAGAATGYLPIGLWIFATSSRRQTVGELSQINWAGLRPRLAPITAPPARLDLARSLSPRLARLRRKQTNVLSGWSWFLSEGCWRPIACRRSSRRPTN